MNDLALINDTPYELMEKVIAEGDLSKLTSQERVLYYSNMCKSLNLNPLTRPFEYIKLTGKLVLYARKDCTEQLRKNHKVSIIRLENDIKEGVYIVTAHARMPDGQEDIGTGAVTIKGLQGEALANAFLKAETKAKRRVTLSICGLGFTDESEISSIPNAKPVKINFETGEFIDQPKLEAIEPPKLIEPTPETLDACIIALDSCQTMVQLKDVWSEINTYNFKEHTEMLSQLIAKKDEIKKYITEHMELSGIDLS
jgi:methionine-rich copper-binding protein CopC